MITNLNKSLREGVFGLPWLFATAPQRKLNEVKPYVVEGFNIPHVCSEVDKLIPKGHKGEMGKAKLSLYLASQLVYGLTLILERKLMLLEVDAQLVYESFIRISCFDELKAPLTNTRPRKGKRKSKAQLDDLHIELDDSFFKEVDLPLPNTEYTTTDMDLITLKDVSHKRSLLLDSFEHRNSFDLFSEHTCFQTQNNNEKNNLTNLTFSAKQLMNDEISLFLPTSISNSIVRKDSALTTAKTGTQLTDESLLSGEIIEISTSEKHIYSDESGENVVPNEMVTISRKTASLSPRLSFTDQAVIKPLSETPKRRSLESLEFELEALKSPIISSSYGINKKRKLVRDDVLQLSYAELRSNMDNFSDTICRPAIFKQKKYPTAEELFNIEPFWYPKNCIQRTLFRSCTAPHCKRTPKLPSLQESTQKSLQLDAENEKSQSRSQLSDWLCGRNGYSYIRETPERDPLELPNNSLNKDNTFNQSAFPAVLPNLEFNESQKSSFKEFNENSPSQQFNVFGSKANRSAKERITVLISESIQPVLLSQLFPVKYTSRKTAAAAFQSVLELLKEGSLLVEQLVPYGEICLKRSSL